MDPTKPVIQSIRQSATITPAGATLRTYVVTFTVGEHGPFTITVPEAEFTVEKVQQRMAEIATTINAIAPAPGV